MQIGRLDIHLVVTDMDRLSEHCDAISSAPQDIKTERELTMTTNTPNIVSTYLKAADDKDYDTLVATFEADAVVIDDGHAHTGRDAIRAWRDANTWNYTTEVTGETSLDEGAYQVDVHLEGDFPGGVVDMKYVFTLGDDLIRGLEISLV